MNVPRAGALRARLESGGFAVTAEIGPPRSADSGPVARAAGLLRGWVDAVNITDNQGSNVRLASWAGCLAALGAGVEPVMQFTCRDRNRIALQSDLLGASAAGVRNVLLLTGDDPRDGDHPDAKPVFDLDSVELLRVARAMRDEGLLMSGRGLPVPPDLFIGAVENPPPAAALAAGPGAGRLARKIDAGAQFVQTQLVFNVTAFAAWLARLRDAGLDKRCYILAGVGVIGSLRAMEFMRDSLPGVEIPEETERRLRGAGAGQVAAEGQRIAAETVRQVRDLPGASGVHIMAFGNDSAVPQVIQDAGLGYRGREPAARQGAAGGH